MSKKATNVAKLLGGVFGGGAKQGPISSARDEQRNAEERAKQELQARAKTSQGRMATVLAGRSAPGEIDVSRPSLLGR